MRGNRGEWNGGDGARKCFICLYMFSSICSTCVYISVYIGGSEEEGKEGSCTKGAPIVCAASITEVEEE